MNPPKSPVYHPSGEPLNLVLLLTMNYKIFCYIILPHLDYLLLPGVKFMPTFQSIRLSFCPPALILFIPAIPNTGSGFLFHDCQSWVVVESPLVMSLPSRCSFESRLPYLPALWSREGCLLSLSSLVFFIYKTANSIYFKGWYKDETQ